MTNELRVARDVMDEIREDLQWVTQNGISDHHGEHTRIVRMARDPLEPDVNELLDVLASTVASANSSELAPEMFDELVSQIAEVVTVVGQEQVNLLLSALDDAGPKVFAAIKASASVTPNAGQESTAPPSSQPCTLQAAAKPSETRRLF